MKNQETLINLYGEVQELITPSGNKIVIRAQNGEDDAIISNPKGAADGSAANRFVQSIIVDSDITGNGKLTMDDVLDMKLCDKYFIMIASRIFSLGQNIHFKYTWEKGNEQEYDEDLGIYIHDYSLDFPYSGDPGYHPYKIKPHPQGTNKNIEITLTSGKEVRYTFINGRGERYLMRLGEDQQSVNSEILARFPELKVGDKWVTIENFKNFSSKEMSEIRTHIDLTDPDLKLLSDLENPKTGEVITYPIMGSTDFFFPRGI